MVEVLGLSAPELPGTDQKQFSAELHVWPFFSICIQIGRTIIIGHSSKKLDKKKCGELLECNILHTPVNKTS